VSCLAGLDRDDAIPPLTAYFAMRVGKLPLLPYHAPGDDRLEVAAEQTAKTHVALLLSNHGPVVGGTSVTAALDALEEVEQTAKLYLLLRGMQTRPLDEAERLRLSPLTAGSP
jgi:ribulose-5-phosphate 4-epimerase/fuculose-1-phosphate aldolase